MPYTAWWALTPLPGTRTYRELLEKGLLRRPRWWLYKPGAYPDYKMSGPDLTDEDMFLALDERGMARGESCISARELHTKTRVHSFVLDKVRTSEAREGGAREIVPGRSKTTCDDDEFGR